MQRISYIICLAVACTYCTSPETRSRVETLPYYAEATFTPHWLTQEEAQIANFHRIGTFELLNQDGDTITEQTFAGKIYVTDFFFTFCPGICPRMTENMHLLQAHFEEDDEVLLLSHSVAPTRDSVEVLKHYAESKGITSDKWHLATGDQRHIYELGRKAYFVEEDLGLNKGIDEFLHTENFVLVDQHQHIRGIYNGLNKADIQQLIADIEMLKQM